MWIKARRLPGLAPVCHTEARKNRAYDGCMSSSEWHRITEFDPEAKRGVCVICGPTQVKIRSETGKARCITPVREQNARYRNSGRRKSEGPRNPEIQRRWKYGLTQSMAELLQQQDGRCAVCKVPLTVRTAHVDHDHACCASQTKGCGKCYRGLLCRHCNWGLGNFRDRPDLLAAAARYLRGFGVS